MKRVMRRMNFISGDEIVEIKGKVACELSACDEIIVIDFGLNGSSLNSLCLASSKEQLQQKPPLC
jgi:hypothetical protein